MTQPAIHQLAKRAKIAAQTLAITPTEKRSAALIAMADALIAASSEIIAANEKDMAACEGTAAFKDRLALNQARIEGMAQGARALAEMDDPVGDVLESWTRPNGLKISRIAVPIGVLGVIYESRPNVGFDAACLGVRSANALVLRGGSESFHSAQAIHKAMQKGLAQAGLPQDCVLIAPSTDRAHVGDMLTATGLIDVIIPRGGKGLVKRVQANARVPVLAHAAGLCHSYVHQSAKPEIARAVVKNAKMRRTGICGATETLLIDKAVAPSLLPQIIEDLTKGGCQFHANQAACEIVPSLPLADPQDFETEWLDVVLNVAVVDDIDAALAHINRYSSHHTEAIIAQDENAQDYFMNRVPSAVVMCNASTQFSDGGQFGFGAEIGISTGRMPPRGPVGPAQLMTYRYHVVGDGQTRPK